MEEADIRIVKRVKELSERHHCKMSEIALAWQWKKGIASPIIGATKTKYVDDAVNALTLDLSKEEIDYLEELYLPHPVVGAIRENPKDGVILLDEKK